MKHFNPTTFLLTILLCAAGVSVSCGDKDDDKDKKEVIEAQSVAIQEAVQSSLQGALVAPPAMQLGAKGYTCEGAITFTEPRGRDDVTIRYSHTCKGK